jgi:hypothetical protein
MFASRAERYAEVIRLRAAGLEYEAIAALLGISKIRQGMDLGQIQRLPTHLFVDLLSVGAASGKKGCCVMTGILGRRGGKRSEVAKPKPRAPRLPKPVEVTAPTFNPVEAWKSFRPNTLLYARLFLETGELPEGCHFVIRERLEPWIAAVAAGGPELRDALLAVVPPIPVSEPEKPREWRMPSDRRAAGSISEIDDPSQIRSALRLAFEGVGEPVFAVPLPLPGEASQEAISEGDPSKSVVLEFAAVKAAETGGETPLMTRISEPQRRGYDSAFNADRRGDAPRLPCHPRYPDKPLTGAAWDRWGRRLIAAIKARTSPPWLKLDEALAALDLKRRPKWLPVGRQDGEEWVEREVVRAHLLYGLPQAESTEVLAAWPTRVPHCRYCGRLSIYGGRT